MPPRLPLARLTRLDRSAARTRLHRMLVGPPPPGEALRVWNERHRAWRVAQRTGRRQVDLYLRLRSAATLPRAYRARLQALRLPAEVIDTSLRQIRSLARWQVVWTDAAQGFLAEARRLDQPRAAGDDDGAAVTSASLDHDVQAARARQRAALCYHVASWTPGTDERTRRTLRAAQVSLFTRSLSLLLPRTEVVQVPWRTARLPGYLRLPSVASGAGGLPLVVLLNGVTTSKEELLLWADAFVSRGLAVLALDQPGTGEAAEHGPPSGEHDDLADAVRAFAAADSRLDATRVALLGVSLGGALAVRAAALDRRIAACVAVTPPFDPVRWLDAVSPVVRELLAELDEDEAALPEAAASFALPPVMERLRCPLLVIGAGRDLVVPPGEAAAVAAAAGPLATLLWYPVAGHGLYDHLAEWTGAAASWLGTVLEVAAAPADASQSTGVDGTLPMPAPMDSTVPPEGASRATNSTNIMS